MEARVRQELLNALQFANERIQQAIGSLNQRQAPDMSADRGVGTQAAQGQAGGGERAQEPSQAGSAVWTEDKGTDQSSMDPGSEQHQEVHPDDMSAAPSDTGHREIHPDDAEA